MQDDGTHIANYDINSVGSGVTARRPAERGLHLLMMERGEFVPRDPDSRSDDAVLLRKKCKTKL